MAAIPIRTTEAGFGRISRVLGLLGVAAVKDTPHLYLPLMCVSVCHVDSSARAGVPTALDVLGVRATLGVLG